MRDSWCCCLAEKRVTGRERNGRRESARKREVEV
jgi:hypothetical protein